MSVIGELARFVREARVSDLPVDERAMLRRQVADIAVAGVAGGRTREADALRALASSQDGDETVALCATIVRHTEVDDIHLRSCVTPGSVAVPVALLLAADEAHLDVARVADAIRVGVEVSVRFGLAVDGPSALYRGVWPTCVGAPLGVAAVAARLWDLDRAQTEHALSLALMLMAGRTGRFQGALSGRWVLFFSAIAEGLRAARAARHGFCGDASLLDGPWLEKAQGLSFDPVKLTQGLGEGGLYSSLSMKPFCTARQALAATEALMQLLDGGLDFRAIEGVVVRVPATYAAMISQPINPDNRSSGFVSVAFQMGLAACRRDGLWDLDREAAMRDSDVLSFASKVSVTADAELQKELPGRWPAAITVTTSAGAFERVALAATGDPDRRLDNAAVADKGLRILEPLFGQPRASEIVAATGRALDDAESCRRVARMLRAAARGADA